MSFVAIPAISKLIAEVEKYPNTLLERVVKENACGGVKRFGRRIPVATEVIKFLRFVIMDRVVNGMTLESESVREAKKALMGSGRYKALCNSDF